MRHAWLTERIRAVHVAFEARGAARMVCYPSGLKAGTNLPFRSSNHARRYLACPNASSAVKLSVYGLVSPGRYG